MLLFFVPMGFAHVVIHSRHHGSTLGCSRMGLEHVVHAVSAAEWQLWDYDAESACILAIGIAIACSSRVSNFRLAHACNALALQYGPAMEP